MHIYASYCGKASNNEVEINTMKHGLIIARRKNFHRLVVEGDSSLVIDILKNIQQGSKWENMSKRLEDG